MIEVFWNQESTGIRGYLLFCSSKANLLHLCGCITKFVKFWTDISFFFVTLYNPGQKKKCIKFFCCYNCCFSCKGSFLIYLHPVCFMNIQLLMELQANIHGNELINSIFLAPTWFMKYTEVFMIFPILFSSWLLKHNGIIDNNCYSRFSVIFSHISWVHKQSLSDICLFADC